MQSKLDDDDYLYVVLLSSHRQLNVHFQNEKNGNRNRGISNMDETKLHAKTAVQPNEKVKFFRL